MRKVRGRAWVVLGLIGLLTGCQTGSTSGLPESELASFRSEGELIAFLDGIENAYASPPVPPPPPPPPPAPQPSPAPPAQYAPGWSNAAPNNQAPGQPSGYGVATTGGEVQNANAVSMEVLSQMEILPEGSITNVQEQGIDEGDIVKAMGNHLVILRRGRLFTVSLASGDLRAIEQINAFPPDVNYPAAWYDEMLVTADQIVVIGYNFEVNATEINRFRLLPDGRLRFQDSHHLSSEDYYSSQNYASRLVGSRLVLYSPYNLYGGGDALSYLPRLRKWRGQDDSEAGFKVLAKATNIFIPAVLRDSVDPDAEVLHSVTTCDLTAAELDCSAMGVLGSDSRNVYVSPTAVYLWLYDANIQRREEVDADFAGAFVYRLPLSGAKPSAIRVRGAPTDQFSFREDTASGVLNVLVREDGEGEGMWRSIFSSGSVALLRLPIRSFGDGAREASAGMYRPLPTPSCEGYEFKNRFVGSFILYGLGAGWTQAQAPGECSRLYAAPVTGGRTAELTLTHPVDRIEALGPDAVVVGSAGDDLVFTAIDLRGETALLGDRYALAAVTQGESRSHAFFYIPDADSPDRSEGVVGLPVGKPGRRVADQLDEGSMAIAYLRRGARTWRPLGELLASPEPEIDDLCLASCDDWYGNARPIFFRGRVFALMGYEVVEGELSETAIREIRRESFAPRPD